MLGELLAAVDEPELMRVAFHLLISARNVTVTFNIPADMPPQG